MTADDITRYITGTFAGVELITAPSGDAFFFYDPDTRIPHDKRQPFATIIHSDAHDAASDLGREGVYRLNIGVKRETYRAMFGDPPPFPRDNRPVNTGHDFTRLDVVMPHPIYAAMHFVCVLSPSDETWEREVKPLLAEAYEQAAAAKHAVRP
jgi:hypothetical protein